MRRAFQGDGIATGKVLRQLDHKEVNVAGAESSKRRGVGDKAREIMRVQSYKDLGGHCKEFGL